MYVHTAISYAHSMKIINLILKDHTSVDIYFHNFDRTYTSMSYYPITFKINKRDLWLKIGAPLCQSFHVIRTCIQTYM